MNAGYMLGRKNESWMMEFVSKAVKHLLSPEEDKMRIGCFERIDCLKAL